VWITDDVGATYTQDPAANFAPSTILRWMSRPGQANYLSFYAAAGGKVWIMGGGAAYATLVDWSRRNTPDDWTNADLELVPGALHVRLLTLAVRGGGQTGAAGVREHDRLVSVAECRSGARLERARARPQPVAAGLQQARNHPGSFFSHVCQ
jgi:hypothetical protein